MFRALYTAASGMTAQQLNLDNIANNLANSGTTGFRAQRLQFEDLLYQNLVTPGSAATPADHDSRRTPGRARNAHRVRRIPPAAGQF